MPVVVPERRGFPSLTRQRAPGPVSTAPQGGTAYAPKRTPRYGEAASSVLDHVVRIRDNAAAVKGEELSNELVNFYNGKLYGRDGKIGIVHKQGDPTELYENLDEEALSRVEDLYARVDSMDVRSRDIVEKAVSKTHAELYKKRILTYGNQYAKYEANTYNAGVANRREALSSSIALGLDEVEDKVDELIAYVEAHNERIGLKDTEGGNRETVAQLNKGLIDAIQLSISEGSFDMAQSVLDRYGHIIDDKAEASILRRLKHEKDLELAVQVASEISQLPIDEQTQTLRDIDPEVRRKVTPVLSSIKSQERQIRNERSEAILSDWMDRALTKSVRNLKELYSDPKWRQDSQYLTASQKRSIASVITVGPSGRMDPSSVREVGRTMFDTRALKEKSFEDHVKTADGLKGPAKGAYMRAVLNAKSGKTDARLNDQIKKFTTQRYKLYKSRTSGQTGNARAYDRAVLDISNEIFKAIEGVPNLRENDVESMVNNIVDKYFEDLKEQESSGVFGRLGSALFGSSIDQDAALERAIGSSVNFNRVKGTVEKDFSNIRKKITIDSILDDNQLYNNLRLEFLKSNGRQPKGTDELLEWVNSR